MRPHELRVAILARYKSIHAFCREHESLLARSAVYQILKGTYPGNNERQAGRIQKALEGEGPKAERIAALLLHVACSHCRARGKNKKSRCRHCKELTTAQAAIIVDKEVRT